MKKEKLKKELLSSIRAIVIAIVLGIIINSTLIVSAQVISASMENTIMTNSRVAGLRISYIFNEPNRFDIILFNPPDEDSDIPYVKRIIGLPNEKVDIIDGKVFINDSTIPLDDSFIKGIARGNFNSFYIPDNCFFVMGDNRNGSVDSRHWNNSFVSRDNIIAKLYIEYFPKPRILG